MDQCKVTSSSSNLAVVFMLLAGLCLRRVYATPVFVFGSSYVDTGNVPNPDSARPYPWSVPYGRTWPGTPSGRYSDGHVLTDLLATALNTDAPTPLSKMASKSLSGVNFAVGGSGVLSAYGFPPISSQIDKLQGIAGIAASYTAKELASAVVVYAPSGDDYYAAITVQNTALSDIYPLTVSVGKQISADLIRLYQLGLRKFAVAYLPPTGCLPLATASAGFQSCNTTWTSNVADPHNSRVFKNVLGLRHYFQNSTIVILDLYSAFSATQSWLGGTKPCCAGTTPTLKCSSLGAGGAPAYSVCASPMSQFYWDDLIHPTEAGWTAVVSNVKSSLAPLMR